ncbi:hypothetical protein BDV29DRAFT_186478 [Aspergillus leporis]|uniref:Uncharacterized protein n=1 Tax=Aspergillus leporis TaxID=41062 RepID=A0A5N5WI90_9EURO|nr:hypothetical protein BDV29DRAFT_186478 [Aspergillus leporis]
MWCVCVLCVCDDNPGPRITVIIIIAHYVSNLMDHFFFFFSLISCPPLSSLLICVFLFILFLHPSTLAYLDLDRLSLSS